MGSGPSRGKKVAPACVSEVTVTQTTARKRDCRAFKPLKIHTVLRNARNRAQQDCHSEGPDSDLSGEEDDDAAAAAAADGELDTVHADDDDEEERKKAQTKKTLVKSKTYGLCHFSREDTEDEVSAADEPRGPRCGTRDVNNKSSEAFTHFNSRAAATCATQHSSTSQGFLTRGVLLDAVSTSEKQSTFGSCDSSSLTMPVIMYDGSEEELMDTIEREYS